LLCKYDWLAQIARIANCCSGQNAISAEWLRSSEIPVRGKHLDDLRPIDNWFIGFSKANTAPFTYFFLRFCWDHCECDSSKISLANTLLPIPCLYILFDATYWILHWSLHFPAVYSLIHKHHHIQKAPSRANVDAVNVHPVEFVLGEYNHLLIVWFWTFVLGAELHAVGAVVFLALGGILAGINHTRYDITIAVPLPWKSSTTSSTTSATSCSSSWTSVTIYDSKAHDVHHRIPQSNYGQYTMFWDHLFGSYRYVLLSLLLPLGACRWGLARSSFCGAILKLFPQAL
jgi:sterol desaturase/sphingolipid hydroxylase (fatty acid hydroxylase superfamily)